MRGMGEVVFKHAKEGGKKSIENGPCFLFSDWANWW
jgi:hypothetical protein